MIFHLFLRLFFRNDLRVSPLLAAVRAAIFVVPSVCPAVAGTDKPMEFVLVHGDMAWCRSDNRCPDWISADGEITRDTAPKLRKFLDGLGDTRLPVIVNSPGGDIGAALEMARTIRQHKLMIAVGRTRWRTCPPTDPTCAMARMSDGTMKGEAYSGGAICSSACTYFFSGGISRVCGQWAWLGVHQATSFYNDVHIRYRTTYGMVNGKRKIISRREVERTLGGQIKKAGLSPLWERKVTRLIDEMGVDKHLFDISLEEKPDQMRNVSQVEARALNLTTELAAAEDLVAARNCKDNEPLTVCAARARIPPRK